MEVLIGISFVALVVGVICGAIGSVIGADKDAAVIGFVLGFFLGPIGLIVACFIDNRPLCPYCRSHIEEQATICPHCRSHVGPPISRQPG